MLDVHFAGQSTETTPRSRVPEAGAFQVVRASHLGMCFGVREAIAKVLAAAERGPLTVLGDLVHNETVLARLASRGVKVCREIDDVRTQVVAITAHGVSDRRRADLRARNLTVLDATCPIVKAAHRAVMALAHDGFHPVVIGTPNHVEVRGLTEDLPAFDVVSREEDVEALQRRLRFGVAAQTTQPIDRVRRLVALLRRRFPASEIQVAETVCMPTRLRQEAAETLAAQSDVTIVVGGATSNNTRELVATCRRQCPRVFRVQDVMEVRPEWCDAARIVGLTAGTSTPDDVIAGVEARLRDVARGRLPRAAAEDPPPSAACARVENVL